MSYADPIQRRKLIPGLRALADFLESDPEIPAPPYTEVLVFPSRSSDIEDQREIDAIASRIGSGTETTRPHRHYLTSRVFGAVKYRAVAIPATGKDR
jgi:hypothetical protein